MRRILIILCGILATFTVSAQEVSEVGRNEVSVSGAWVSRENRTLVIDYSIDFGENIISCNIELLMSLDGGRTFNQVTVTDNVQGDVGRITSSGKKRIIYDIDSIKERLAGKELAFKVQVKNKKKMQTDKGKFFMMGNVSTLKMYGLRVGFVKKFGGYVSFSDAFSDGMLANWTVTAGGMIRAASWLYPYIGAGYGQLNFYEYDTMYNMIPFEAGTMFKLGPVSLSAAVEPILVLGEGLACTFELGVGFCF